MVCRVCKRELESPICSFCGEDNTSYMNDKDAEKIENQAEILPEKTTGEKKKPAKIKKYKLDVKKLIKLIVVVGVIVALIVIVKGMFNKKEEVIPPDPRTVFSSDMLAVYSDGEWGYVNLADPSVYAVEPQFRTVTEFYGDIAFACIGGKYCAINKSGQLVTEPRFDGLGPMSDNGYIAVETEGKWGYIKNDGTYVIDPKFTTASAFSGNKTALVSVNGAYGYIGEDGEYTIAPQYEMALPFSDDGYAAIKSNGKWGYINSEGAAVIEPRFEEANNFVNSVATVKLYGDYGVINTEGKFIINPMFDEYFEFDSHGYAKVKVGNKYGYIDKSGNYVIDHRFHDIGEFKGQELTFASLGNGMYGFVNRNGKFAIKAKYADAGEFSNGLAPVCTGDLWGYIGLDGTMVIEPQYTYAYPFGDEGYAVVYDVLGKIVLIDNQGNVVTGSKMSIDAVMIK